MPVPPLAAALSLAPADAPSDAGALSTGGALALPPVSPLQAARASIATTLVVIRVRRMGRSSAGFARAGRRALGGRWGHVAAGSALTVGGGPINGAVACPAACHRGVTEAHTCARSDRTWHVRVADGALREAHESEARFRRRRARHASDVPMSAPPRVVTARITWRIACIGRTNPSYSPEIDASRRMARPSAGVARRRQWRRLGSRDARGEPGSGGLVGLDPIADRAHRDDPRAADGLELRAQAGEVRLEPQQVGIGLGGPAGAGQPVVRDEVAARADERLEEPELRRREAQRDRADARLVAGRLERERARR